MKQFFKRDLQRSIPVFPRVDGGNPWTKPRHATGCGFSPKGENPTGFFHFFYTRGLWIAALTTILSLFYLPHGQERDIPHHGGDFHPPTDTRIDSHLPFQTTAIPATGTLFFIEPWWPECLMDVPELAHITDPEAFDQAARQWLEVNQATVAHDIARRRGMGLLGWHHIDGTPWGAPYGATMVWLCQSTHSKGGAR